MGVVYLGATLPARSISNGVGDDVGDDVGDGIGFPLSAFILFSALAARVLHHSASGTLDALEIS